MPTRPTCERCLRPERCCVCSLIQPVHNRTPVLIIQHPDEAKHAFNTVRLVRLALRAVEVRVAVCNEAEQPLCPPCAPEGAVLLYPGGEAQPIETLTQPPASLVLVDGTWSTARKLVYHNPWIGALPRVSLRPEGARRVRLRRAPRPELQLSSIEAIAAALSVLEPNNDSIVRLLEAFEGMVEQQLAVQRLHGGP